ncbi:hypothetical protein [Thiomicrorhabdus lithotrophica]|uniref:SoxXA-binding protein SoxK n=1 Tax=Thiomicrorhabdus lithotrophica TaxID=2949997 RepID=A0ABY8CCT0_9GAMM|nr:hypothetical protein [Thiomicrorhabdus lithotrophica]WEJ63282.1 hypothetical protein NR989_03245 [Thiomicrorhabdus lithotrophica]
MKKLIIGTAIVAALSMGGCTSNEAKPTSYADYVASATAAHAKAKAVNNVWKQKKMKKSYVETYLAKADEAKKKGDEAAALKYAKEAYKSANAEVAQMEAWKGQKAGWEK